MNRVKKDEDYDNVAAKEETLKVLNDNVDINITAFGHLRSFLLLF